MTKKPDPEYCPMHVDEPIEATYVGTETAEWEFVCTRKTGHPGGLPYSRPYVPEPVSIPGDTLGLGLDIELPAAVKAAVEHAGTPWVEYGIVEYMYAKANPADWARLLREYSHTYYAKELAQEPGKRYTASAYLGFTLGGLVRAGALAHRMAPGTGRWDYNNPISWVALPSGGDWEERTSWDDSGLQMAEYMPDARPR